MQTKPIHNKREHYDPRQQVIDMKKAKTKRILDEILALNAPDKEARIHEIRDKLAKYKKFITNHNLLGVPNEDVEFVSRSFIGLARRLINDPTLNIVRDKKYKQILRRDKYKPNKIAWRQYAFVDSKGNKQRGRELIECSYSYMCRFVTLWDEYRNLLNRQ